MALTTMLLPALLVVASFFAVLLLCLISFFVGASAVKHVDKESKSGGKHHYLVSYHAVYHSSTMPVSERDGITNQICSIVCTSESGPISVADLIAALMQAHQASLVVLLNISLLEESQIKGFTQKLLTL